MHDPPLLAVLLISLCVESLGYGALCVLYLFSLWVLLYRRRRHQQVALKLSMAAIVTVMFLLSGVYLAIDVRHLMKALVDHSGTADGPLNYLSQPVADPSRNVHPIVFAIMTFLGDGFMTYRIYVVWNRELSSLIVPVLLLIGDLIAASFTAHVLLKGPRVYNTILVAQAFPQTAAYLSMTLLTNVVTTLLLLGRLWWYDNKIKRYRFEETRAGSTSVHWQVMKTIIQSEAAYSLGVILNLVAYSTSSNLALLTNALLTPLIGISFTLIITHIGISELFENADSQDAGPLNVNALELNTGTQAQAAPTLTPISLSFTVSHTLGHHDPAARRFGKTSSPSRDSV